MQSPLTSFITGAMQKPSRFLYRDFFEIELSQSSKHMTDNFVSKAYIRTEEALTAELQRHPKVGVVGTENPLPHKINFSVCAIDGIKNLTRALPFFSISVCAYYVDNDGVRTPQNCVIDFPALGEIYYAEKGKGVLLVKNASANASIKMKPSTHSNPHMALATDEFAGSIACEKRNFGCFSYELGLLAAGKADLLASTENSEHFKLVARLLSEETGCKILPSNSIIMSNGHCTLNA